MDIILTLLLHVTKLIFIFRTPGTWDCHPTVE